MTGPGEEYPEFYELTLEERSKVPIEVAGSFEDSKLSKGNGIRCADYLGDLSPTLPQFYRLYSPLTSTLS